MQHGNHVTVWAPSASRLHPEQATMPQGPQAQAGASNRQCVEKQPSTIANNKWSHNKINQSRMSRPRRPQRGQNGARLALSVLTGLALAAVHSSALTSTGSQTTSSSSSSAPPAAAPSSALGHQVQQASNSQASALHGAASSSLVGHAVQPALKPSVNLNESPAINLIPVDQPVFVGNSGPLSSFTPITEGPTGSSRLKDSYDGSSLNLRSGLSVSPPTDTGAAGPPASNTDSSPVDDFGSQSQHQQQTVSDDDFTEPAAQYYATPNQNDDGPGVYQSNTEHQDAATALNSKQGSAPKSGLVSPRVHVERRFGLFKKGHHQQHQQPFGAPAQYISSPFMSECERCFAGLGQQAADLQLEPLPQPPPTTVPQPSLPPASIPPQMGAGNHFPMQPFSPFKNKFFMKFPFFVKPSFDSLHSSSYSGPAHYWPMAPAQPIYHHQHSSSGPSLRPSPAAMNQALFVRPAPSYNCIQASPSMLAAAASSTNQAEVIPLSSPTKTAPLSTKHLHYTHQQQMQSGYAK